MILHFLTDSKFSEYVLKQFRSLSIVSKFVVVEADRELRHFEGFDDIHVVRPDSNEFKQLVNGLTGYKAVVLHGLFWPWEEYILEHVPKEVKVAWVFWGGEIYGREDLRYSFLAPISKFLFKCHRLLRLLKKKGKALIPYEIPKALFRRVDFCLTDIPEEYQFATDYLCNGMAHLWYNYYSIEETLGDAMFVSGSGDNILIGHSGTIEGNHLEVFRRIKKSSLQNRRIVSPLSYGDGWVINLVSKVGERKYGKAFYPIMGFMPRIQYNEEISECNIVIMNHFRPQAMGNIITALWLGKRVYMSERSMQYHYLKSLGIVLFSIENDLSQDISSPGVSLSPDCISRNKQILLSVYGREAARKKIEKLVKILDS